VGGLAGFIALSTKDKGNVIPGVAIATALMPPLCTAGFGIATGNFRFFLGAFYLYFINTVFIVSATFVGTRLRGYEHKVFREKKREQAVKQSILAIVVITMIPALWLTIDIVRSSIYENEANQYIDNSFLFPDTQIISRNISYENKTIDLMLIGREVPEDALSVARSQMNGFRRLEDTRLTVVQGGKERVDLDAIRSSILEDFYQKSEERIRAQQEIIDTLSVNLDQYRYYEALSSELIGELTVLYPSARELSISQAINVTMDNQAKDTLTIAVVKFDSIPPAEQLHVMSEWLKTRIDTQKLRLIAE